MSEGINLEQEIAQLTAQISEKKAALERERGSTVESHEIIHTIVGEGLGTSVSNPVTNSNNKNTTSVAKSYLDDIDPKDVEKINQLIDALPKLGIAKTIARAKEEIPFILDAFHDALADRLHEELKRQKII